MRRDVLHDAVFAGGELRHHVGRRCLNQIDLTVEQRVGTRHRVGNRHEHQSIGFGNARFVPVGGVFHQLGALARHQLVELEGAGARRLHRHFRPVFAQLVPLHRAADEEPWQLIREQRVGVFGGDGHRVVVELFVRRN